MMNNALGGKVWWLGKCAFGWKRFYPPALHGLQSMTMRNPGKTRREESP